MTNSHLQFKLGWVFIAPFLAIFVSFPLELIQVLQIEPTVINSHYKSHHYNCCYADTTDGNAVTSFSDWFDDQAEISQTARISVDTTIGHVTLQSQANLFTDSSTVLLNNVKIPVNGYSIPDK